MMEIPDRKTGKIFLIFAGLCILALPLVVLAAFTRGPESTQTAPIEPGGTGFDENSAALFQRYERLSRAYSEGISTERTLEGYYARRQYPGSPPYVPHPLEPGKNDEAGCLTCHARGGWTADMKRNTPLTPHPENTACQQCHVATTDRLPFVDLDWVSVSPPRLGRSHLPGGPPPIPHGLQMRGDCIACHVGPGAVSAIRVLHAARGNCRQCHVPDLFQGLFQRKPAS